MAAVNAWIGNIEKRKSLGDKVGFRFEQEDVERIRELLSTPKTVDYLRRVWGGPCPAAALAPTVLLLAYQDSIAAPVDSADVEVIESTLLNLGAVEFQFGKYKKNSLAPSHDKCRVERFAPVDCARTWSNLCL